MKRYRNVKLDTDMNEFDELEFSEDLDEIADDDLIVGEIVDDDVLDALSDEPKEQETAEEIQDTEEE